MRAICLSMRAGVSRPVRNPSQGGSSAGLQCEIIVRQYDIEFARMARRAGCHGLGIFEFHGVRHVHVVHEAGLICVLGGSRGVVCCRQRVIVFPGGHFRIIDQLLPELMAAVAIIEVAGFAGDEIRCGIIIDLARMLPCLRKGMMWHFFAAGNICCGNVINRSRFQ